MSISTMNSITQVFCGRKFSTQLNKYLGTKLLDCMVSLFSFVEKYQFIFQSGYTEPHVHQQCMRQPVSTHPFQHVIFISSLGFVILVSI